MFRNTVHTAHSRSPEGLRPRGGFIHGERRPGTGRFRGSDCDAFIGGQHSVHDVHAKTRAETKFLIPSTRIQACKLSCLGSGFSVAIVSAKTQPLLGMRDSGGKLVLAC